MWQEKFRGLHLLNNISYIRAIQQRERGIKYSSVGRWRIVPVHCREVD